MFAQPLMDVMDMSLSQKLCETNVVEGISMLQNDYVKCGHSVKRYDMSDSEGSNHFSSQSAKHIISESKERMKLLFLNMGINCDTQVIVFPHMDAGNQRALLYDWLMTTSKTEEHPPSTDTPKGYHNYVHYTYMAYQRKCNEDTEL